MNELLWYLSRASGLVSLVLLTASLVLGMLTAGRAGGGSAVRSALHRTISLLMVAFIGAHVLTAIVETYVDIGWLSLLIPFTSGYERFWVGLGTLGFDLFVAITVTSVFRHRISGRAWKLVHLAAYAMWPIALVHGIGTADADSTLALVISLGCLVTVLVAAVVRLRNRSADADRRQLISAQGWS